jgi:hypothetical protein
VTYIIGKSQAKHNVNIFYVNCEVFIGAQSSKPLDTNHPFNPQILRETHKQTSCLANRSPKNAGTKQFIFRAWFGVLRKGWEDCFRSILRNFSLIHAVRQSIEEFMP